MDSLTKKIVNELKTKNKVKELSSPKELNPGDILLFGYPNPKYEDSLWVFDALPLIIFLGYDGNCLHGINIHYLPYKERLIYIRKILEIQKRRKLIYKDIVKLWKSSGIAGKYSQYSYRKYLPNLIPTKIKVFNTDSVDVIESILLIQPQFKKQRFNDVYRNIAELIKKG